MAIDLAIFKFINQTFTFSVLDIFFPYITDLHKAPWFAYSALALVLFIFIRKYKRQGLTLFLILALGVSVCDFTGGRIKRYFNRPRPFQNFQAETIQRSPASENTSFYSNHASNNFTFATYMTGFFPEVKILFFTIAGLVSYSRIYNGVHYPSDVFAGALAGLLWGSLFKYLAFYILRRIGTKEKSV